MYIILPASLLVGSVAIIVWIVLRKFTYLKRLTPEALEATMGVQDGFFTELFPELTALIRRINLRAYGVNFLTEFEKLLRKFRLISLKIDGLTNRLIHRVRKETKEQVQILKETKIENDEKSNGGDNLDLIDELGDSQEDLRQKEQLLIIEIAKNPKDTQLYKELGTIYMRTGEWEDAKQSFEKVLDLEPDDETTKRRLGRVLSKIEAQAK